MKMLIIEVIIVLLVGYLLGSVNTSIIVGKAKGIDIREHGSGNAGLTNTFRVLGKSAAVVVVLGDILKGIAAAYIGEYILGTSTIVPRLGILICGLGAIIGHNFPLYFKFKGGKGILTTAAVVATLNIKIAVFLFVVFVLTIVVTRYVSLGSILSSIFLPLAVYLLEKGRERIYFLIWSIVVSLSALIMHRKNISRILKGEETVLSFEKRCG